MNVIGYIRVSTIGQARDGYSLAYQEDDMRRLVRIIYGMMKNKTADIIPDQPETIAS